MTQLLLEGELGAVEFKIDHKNLVFENQGGNRLLRARGLLSLCDGTINGNGREYTKSVWEKNLQPKSRLMVLISENSAFGTLEHPRDGKITLESPISHSVVDVKLEENGRVTGEIIILGTADGRKLQALIEGGYNPKVSSRGYGSLVKMGNREVVQDDYICEGWDVVMLPSCEKAEVKVIVTDPVSVPASPMDVLAQKEAKVKESLTEIVTKSVAKETSAKNLAPKPERKPMELNEIKQAIGSVRAVDPAKLDPTRFAESMNTISKLHNDVSEWAAQDPKRSYEAHTAHRDLETLEVSYAKAALAPKLEVKALQENGIKLVKVLKAVTQTGINLKTKLTESLKAKNETTKLLHEVVKRGRGWRRVANESKTNQETLQEKLEVTCEALDQLATLYKADMTKMGKKVLELEFADKIATPEIKEALEKATHPNHIVALREKLTQSKEIVTPTPAPVAEAKAEVKEEKKLVTEVKVVSSQNPAGVVVTRSNPTNPRSLVESIAMTRRLSEATQFGREDRQTPVLATK